MEVNAAPIILSSSGKPVVVSVADKKLEKRLRPGNYVEVKSNGETYRGMIVSYSGPYKTGDTHGFTVMSEDGRAKAFWKGVKGDREVTVKAIPQKDKPNIKWNKIPEKLDFTNNSEFNFDISEKYRLTARWNFTGKPKNGWKALNGLRETSITLTDRKTGKKRDIYRKVDDDTYFKTHLSLAWTNMYNSIRFGGKDKYWKPVKGLTKSMLDEPGSKEI